MILLCMYICFDSLLCRAAALTNIQTFFESHPMNSHSDWETRGIPYQLQLCDKEFLRHCLMALRLSPRTEISRAASLLLRCASNVSYVNAAIMDPSVKGVKQILDAISSTSHARTLVTVTSRGQPRVLTAVPQGVAATATARPPPPPAPPTRRQTHSITASPPAPRPA